MRGRSGPHLSTVMSERLRSSYLCIIKVNAVSGGAIIWSELHANNKGKPDNLNDANILYRVDMKETAPKPGSAFNVP